MNYRPFQIAMWWLLAGACLLAPPAVAGKITVTDAQPGTTARITFVSGSGAQESKEAVVGTDGNAEFSFPAEQQKNATRIRKRYIPKRLPGQEVDFPPNNSRTFFREGALPSLEPYLWPNFLPSSLDIELDVEIDLENYLDEAPGFFEGQTLTVTGGLITQTPTITFGDFTGEVTVAPFDLVEPIPEPSTVTLILMGSAALAMKAQRAHTRRPNLVTVREQV